MRLIAVLAAWAVAGLALVVWLFAGGGGERAGQIVPYEDAEAVALGKTLYAEHCAACHGASLEGQVEDWRTPGPDGLMPAPPHDETGHTWHHPDRMLIDITARGSAAVVGGGYRSAMPGFGDVLSDEEIRAVLAYIKSTWPEEVIDIHDRINAEAAAR